MGLRVWRRRSSRRKGLGFQTASFVAEEHGRAAGCEGPVLGKAARVGSDCAGTEAPYVGGSNILDLDSRLAHGAEEWVSEGVMIGLRLIWKAELLAMSE
ncbi:unnamed protein product [Dovyalis caffra]|uniref:Arginase n=1 Tax=Dovyalis caffra TaxID=77055 RepID=A0AAV1QSW0_9ROSI|nr:unnamed protein product [Dovyalis caffra]